MKKSTKEWLNAANDDIKAMEKLFSDPVLTNIVAFHAQQAVEKSFKAVIEEFNWGTVKTHNLETLYAIIESYLSIEVDERIIAELDRLYIDTRYPGDFGLMPHGKPGLDETQEYYNEAKRLHDVIQEKLL